MSLRSIYHSLGACFLLGTTYIVAVVGPVSAVSRAPNLAIEQGTLEGRPRPGMGSTLSWGFLSRHPQSVSSAGDLLLPRRRGKASVKP